MRNFPSAGQAGMWQKKGNKNDTHEKRRNR